MRSDRGKTEGRTDGKGRIAGHDPGVGAWVVIDEAGRLVLIRRARPGRSPYLTLPGGGVEADDTDDAATLAREVAEETGLRVVVGPEVLRWDDIVPAGTNRQRVRLARVVEADPDWVASPESADPARGTYEVIRVPSAEWPTIADDLSPGELAALVRDRLAGMLTAWVADGD